MESIKDLNLKYFLIHISLMEEMSTNYTQHNYPGTRLKKSVESRKQAWPAYIRKKLTNL